MKRTLVALIALPVSIGMLAACSNDGDATVTSGGKTEVSVDGKPLDGLDVNSVACAKQGGKLIVSSASAGGQQGLGVTMTDGNPPTVENLTMLVDGNALAVSTTPVKSGSASVKVDGKTYTITGEAQGADLKNPLSGQITKPFTIKVSCG